MRYAFGCPIRAKVIVVLCAVPGVGTGVVVVFFGFPVSPSRPKELVPPDVDTVGTDPRVGTDASLLPRC